MYEFRNLENISFEEFANVYNSAFSDYIANVQLTTEGIEALFKVSGVDYSQSYGAFYENKLIGILINAVDTYRGDRIAFDVVTGITKEHRGNSIFSKLFEHTKIGLKNNNISRYFLEVITTNERAYNIYCGKGATIEREFSFLKGRINSESCRNDEVKVSPLSAFSMKETKEFSNYEPSFGNRLVALYRDIDNYQVAYIEKENRSVAVVYSNVGRISQIKYSGEKDKDLLYAVMTYLSKKFDEMKISNIPITETELINALTICGFPVLVNQYEMSIKIL